jgi:ATP-dependent DNA helicase RecG
VQRRSAEELLEQLRTSDESSSIEAKRGRDIGSSVLETACAFANTPGLGGGYILLGVAVDAEEDPPTYQVVGVSDPDKLQKDLVSNCRNGTFNQPLHVEVTTERLEGCNVVAAFVAELPPASKPAYFVKLGLPKGAFLRRGSVDVKCTDAELRALYQTATSFEDGPAHGVTVSALSAQEFVRYRQRVSAGDAQAHSLGRSDAELLRGLNLTVGASDVPTLAGVLAFGDEALLERCLPSVRVSYLRIQGTRWVDDPERRFERLHIRAPLLETFLRLTAAIEDDLPKLVQVPADSPERVDHLGVPRRVVREVVANALSHRDYSVGSHIQVIRYANRLEVKNPGYSLVSEDELGQAASNARNPRIAQLFGKLRLAENEGTGVETMRREMKAANLTPPLFESDREGNTFKVTLLFHHLVDDAARAWLGQLSDFRLDDLEVRAVLLVRDKGSVRNADLREVTGADVLQASKVLRKLRDAGLLRDHGKGSATEYLPGSGFPGLRDPAARSDKQEPGSNRQKLDENRQELSTPNRQELAAVGQELGLEPELLEEIAGLTPKARPQQLHPIILRVCNGRWVTAEQLARLLDRDMPRLVRGHLSPLVGETKLERRYAEAQHPNQAYRTRQLYLED